MNNAFLTENILTEETTDVSPEVQARAIELSEIIEALQNIANSSYWKVLQKNVFDVELAKSKRRLETANDTTEIFRLQGEVRLGRRYHLNKLITKYRDELTAIKKKING